MLTKYTFSREIMDIKKIVIIAAIALIVIIGFNYYSSAQSEKNRTARIAETEALRANIMKKEIEQAPSVTTAIVKNETSKAQQVVPVATVVASDDDLFGSPTSRVAQVDTAKKAALTADKAKLDNALLRWNDAMKVAITTPRIQLDGKIEGLQAIKLEVLTMDLNPCMNEPRNRLANAMGIFIDGLLEFKSNTNIGVFLFRDYAQKANKDMELYNVISNQCITLS